MADTTQMPNPPAPKGGYQQGGWYQGRQAWQDAGGNWTFSDPGQINPLSDQVGAGQQVSKEVQTQSSIAQTGNPQALQTYFDNYGKVIEENLKNIDLTGAGADGAIGGVINGARPTPPNLTQTYQTLAGQYGISNLTKQINDLTAQKRQVQQSVVNAAGDTEAQPGVTADVVAGRESEQQRQADKQIANIDLQIQTATDQLNAANGTISMIMQFTQQDYQNSSSAYDTQFSQAIQYQELLNSEASTANKLASANWQTVANLITTGVIDPTKLTPAQNAQINQFETAAGLPSGITGLLQGGGFAGATVVDSNKNTGTMTLKMPNGTFQTVSSGQPAAPTKIGNYDYTYNQETGDYEIVPGQGLFGTNFGIFAPSKISGGTGTTASTDTITATLKAQGYTQSQINYYLKAKGLQ